jgi:hypothetical protein
MALSQLHEGRVTIDKFEHVVADPEAATCTGEGPQMEQLSYVTTATMTGKGIANGKELDSCARF